jgi:hypothetical protein
MKVAEIELSGKVPLSIFKNSTLFGNLAIMTSKLVLDP